MPDSRPPALNPRRTARWVVTFSLLVLALAFTGRSLGGSARQPGPGFVLWGATPLLVALGLRLATRDWSDLGLRPGLRGNARWYLLGFVAWPAAMIATLLVAAAAGKVRFEAFAPARFFGLALLALAGLLIPAFVEEFGWRGYLAPKEGRRARPQPVPRARPRRSGVGDLARPVRE